MKCTDAEILINDKFDGLLDSQSSQMLTEHLQNCKNCARIESQMNKLVSVTNSLPQGIYPPADLWKGIESSISNTSFEVKRVSPNSYTFKANESPFEKSKPVFSSRYIYYPAAALFLICASFFLYTVLTGDSQVSQITASTNVYWQLDKVKGSPKVIDKVINTTDSIKVGDWIITDDSSEAILKVANIGTIRIDPGTKLMLLKSTEGEHRIKLEYGKINAKIIASPRQFFVETASATAIDLGCEYSFAVNEQGDGMLYVKEGMVELQAAGRESLVPAGKLCITKAGIGPGTPYNELSSPTLKQALLNYDFNNGGENAINIIIKNAGKMDAVTLANLLPKVNGPAKQKIYNRLSGFVPPPRAVSLDSLKDLEDMNEWMEKVHKQIAKDMEKLNEQMKNNFNFEFKYGEMTPEKQKELDEKIAKIMEKTNEIIEKQMETILKSNNIVEEQMKKLDEEMKSRNFNFEFDKNYDFDFKLDEKELEKLEKFYEHHEELMEKHEEQLEKSLEKLEEQQEKIEQDAERIEREAELLEESLERESEIGEKELELEMDKKEKELEEKLNK